MALLEPELRSNGLLYKKTKQVYAKQATAAEEVVTLTADGRRARNVANTGDFIVKNQTEAKEEYVVKESKFKDRYDYLREDEDDFHLYNAKGKVIGLELTEAVLERLQLPNPFEFVAPWGEISEVKAGDFLVTLPDYSEVYRITGKEFDETYDPDTELI